MNVSADYRYSRVIHTIHKNSTIDFGMAIFLLVPTAKNAARLRAAIAKHIRSEDHYEVSNEAGFFVRFKGTSVELSNVLEITGQPSGAPTPIGSVVIVPVTSYYGRGATDMWEWLKSRMESGA